MSVIVSLVFSSALAHSVCAGENAPEADDSNAAKNLARMNCGATIDLITPDGRVAEVGNAKEKSSSASALIMDDNTLSCPLQEGDDLHHYVPEDLAPRPFHFPE